MPICFDLKKYRNEYNVFIETGTYNGDGVQAALNAGFSSIYSIELDPTRHKSCVNRFAEMKTNVHILCGDSSTTLPTLLQHIKEPAVFWLDAHYCNDDAKIGDKWTPLKEEMDAIARHPIKTHTIIIDDWRCMDNQHVDKRTQREVGFPGKENCLARLREINPEYTMVWENGAEPQDVLVCCVVAPTKTI